MSAEAEVYAALSGFSGLISIVGAAIYPDVLPEKTPYPAVVFARVRTEPVISISNVYFGADVGLQVSCWGESRTEVDAAAVQADAALKASGILPTGRQSGYDPDAGLYAAVIDTEIFEQP